MAVAVAEVVGDLFDGLAHVGGHHLLGDTILTQRGDQLGSGGRGREIVDRGVGRGSGKSWPRYFPPGPQIVITGQNFILS